MSFSADVKAELARIKVEKKCDMLAEISGMDAVTLQPVAGAHGELTGL